MNKREWRVTAKNILKVELTKKNIDYKNLSEKLLAIGIHENPANLNSKINRGTFSFIFFIQCMQAIGTYNFNIESEKNIDE